MDRESAAAFFQEAATALGVPLRLLLPPENPPPDTMIFSAHACRMLARRYARWGVEWIEPFMTEARAYLAKKARRRERMRRKKRRGWA